MSIVRPSKKLRLEQQQQAAASTTEPGNNQNVNDDSELWGEELCVDDQLMQEIESQAISQYQVMSRPAPAPAPAQTQNDYYPPPQQQTRDYGELERNLQMKQGEVKNLRMEKDKIVKEFRSQLDVKDDVIRELNKRLQGKQSELEFQIAQMKSQTCRTPKIHKTLRLQRNVSSSPFRERFQFTPGKSFVKDGKVFNFGGQLNKGEVLYKLVRRAFNLNEANFRLGIEKGNDFTWFLNCCLLKLCRFTSFDKSVASDLLTLMISRSREVFCNFLQQLSASDEKTVQKFKSENIKVMVLRKADKDRYRTNEAHLLLTNAKWYLEESAAVAVRQTIATLAKLIQIEEPLLNRIITRTNRDEACENRYSQQTEFIATATVFDVIQLLDEMIDEIALQNKYNYRYEGVHSSVLYFFTIFCARFRSEHLYDKHATRMVNVLKKIMLSVPGFVATRYFVHFLNSSARFNLCDHLCHRSAAETFSENFTSYSFSLDTCVLQVLCAHLEMMDKSSDFINIFASWLIKMNTASSRRIGWMKNETNAKLCECLPTLEQTTVRIMLRCVERSDDQDLSWTEKQLLNSSIKRCFRIFKQFRWQDDKFHIHVANRSMEYEMLLFRLMRLSDGRCAETNVEFTSEEINAVRNCNKFLSQSTAHIQQFINSVLDFSPIVQ